MKTHKRKTPTSSPFLMFAMTTVIVLAMLLLAALCSAQTLHNHNDAPALVQPTCQEQLGAIKEEMLRVNQEEIVLHAGDRQAIHFYQQRDKVVLTTHDLVPSILTCTTGSIRDLNYIVAHWRLEYVMEAFGPKAEDGHGW